MNILLAFVIGGFVCVLAQLLLDNTNLTPGHVMVSFVVLGAVVSGLGLYDKMIEVGGAGLTLPLTAFGHVLVQGMLTDIGSEGWLGLLTGGLKAASMPLTAAILLGLGITAVFQPRA